MSIFISFSGIARQEYAIKFMNFFNKHGFKTWYDQHELLLGDDLSETIIEEGIKKSEYAVIIINEEFLNKEWPCTEAQLLYERYKKRGDITLFPILLNITKSRLKASHLNFLLEIKYQFLKSGETIDKIGFQILNRIFDDKVKLQEINTLDIAFNCYKRLTLMSSMHVHNLLLLLSNFDENDYKSKCIVLICLVSLLNDNPYDKITQNISYMIYSNVTISFDIYKVIESIFLICSELLFTEKLG